MWGLLTSYVFFSKAEDGVRLDRFRKQNETEAPNATSANRQAVSARDQQDEEAEADEDETSGA
jgi:hypothetical protein